MNAPKLAKSSFLHAQRRIDTIGSPTLLRVPRRISNGTFECSRGKLAKANGTKNPGGGMRHPRYPAFILFLLLQLKRQLPSTPLQIHLLFDFSHPPALGYCISAYIRVQRIIYNRTLVFGFDFLEIHSV